MENLNDFRTPGQLIESLLHERGWSNRILATVLEIEETGVSKLISATRAVTPDLAIALEEVFGVSADIFLDLQKKYELAKARIVARPNPSRAARAKMFADLPVPEMIKRGWLKVDDIRNLSVVESEVKQFFKSSDFSEIGHIVHAAKKTAPQDSVNPAQLAWLYRVKQIAEQMLAPPYSEKATLAAIAKFKTYLSAPEEARHVPLTLLQCGIRFVVVEGLKGSKIDGACIWLDKKSPVIALTARFDRMDNFWFVLRHELEHVLRHHGLDSPMLDVDIGVGVSVIEEEQMANAAASEFCAPAARIESFIARKAPMFPERDFLGLSKVLGVHPCIVAGQIHFRTGRYELFRAHIAKIRHCVLPSAVVDGWGDIAPVGI